MENTRALLYICENKYGPKGRNFFEYRAEFEQNKGVRAEF